MNTEIVAQGVKTILREPEPCILKLLSGDRDFIPLINIATEESWETEMWAFQNSFNYSGEMAQTVTRIKPLDSVFSQIGRNEGHWPIQS